MTVSLDTRWFTADFPHVVEEEGPTPTSLDGIELSTYLFTSEEPDDIGVFTVRVTVLEREELRELVRQSDDLRESIVNQFGDRLIESLAADSEVEVALDENVPVEHFSYRRLMFRFPIGDEEMACVAAVSLAEHCIIEQFGVVACDEPSIDRAIEFVSSVRHKL